MELNELNTLIKEGFGYTWTMYLLKFSKKDTGVYSADHIVVNEEYMKCNLGDLLDTISDKIMNMDGIIPYTEGILSKGYLSYISKDDHRINDNFTRFYESILNAPDTMGNTYTGYCLRGVSGDGRELLIINKSNPFVNLREMMITPSAYEFQEPALIKLQKRIDVLVADGEIYADQGKLEAIFGMDSSNRALCEANRNLLIDANIFNEASKAMLMNPRLLMSFKNIDMEAAEGLKNQIDSAKLLRHYSSFEYQSDGAINIGDTATVKILIKYMSGKIVEKDGALFEATTLKPLAMYHE